MCDCIRNKGLGDWEIGIDMYTLMCIKLMPNKKKTVFQKVCKFRHFLQMKEARKRYLSDLI